MIASYFNRNHSFGQESAFHCHIQLLTPYPLNFCSQNWIHLLCKNDKMMIFFKQRHSVLTCKMATAIKAYWVEN